MSNRRVKETQRNLNKKDIIEIMNTDPSFLKLTYRIAESLGYKKSIVMIQSGPVVEERDIVDIVIHCHHS